MSYQITCIERYVIESIGKNSLTMLEIEKSTGLKKDLLNLLIQEFLASDILNYDRARYSLNFKNYKKSVRNKEHLSSEVAQIVESCFLAEESQFHLKKIHLNERDEKIFNALVKNVEHFLESVEVTNQNIKEKQVFFWGGGNYENICNNILSN
jgi:hypothetical protein